MPPVNQQETRFTARSIASIFSALQTSPIKLELCCSPIPPTTAPSASSTASTTTATQSITYSTVVSPIEVSSLSIDSNFVCTVSDQVQVLSSPSPKSCTRTITISLPTTLTATTTTTATTQYWIHSLKAKILPSTLLFDFSDKTCLANGFQSWSKSMMGMNKSSSLHRPNWFYDQLTHLGLASDQDIFEYSAKKGLIHSNIFTVLQYGDNDDERKKKEKKEAIIETGYKDADEEDAKLLLGSLSEDQGYNYCVIDFEHDELWFWMDLKGKLLASSALTEIKLKLFFAWDTQDTVLWDGYAAAWQAQFGDLRRQPTNDLDKITGWTSWYCHAENVNEGIVRDTLEGYRPPILQSFSQQQRRQKDTILFQIDDGYTVVGDWLDHDSAKFPNGMKYIADMILQSNRAEQSSQRILPGLWLAPFVASRKSKLVMDHPDWFLKTDTGEGSQDFAKQPGKFLDSMGSNSSKLHLAHPAFHAGANALDIFNPEVQAYLSHVFTVVTQEWGFKILKLDFLFAVASRPRPDLNKSRGQIMWEAMRMIRTWAGPNTILLGCGVPLGSAMMVVDYCRIGCDVGPKWDSSIQKRCHDREYISCQNSLTSTLSRWGLGKRFFGNDPDVWYLRNWGLGLTKDEKWTLMVLNQVMGQLVLTSDDQRSEQLDMEQKKILSMLDPWPEAGVQVERVVQPLAPECGDVYLIQLSLSTPKTRAGTGVQGEGGRLNRKKTIVVATNFSSSRQHVSLSKLDGMLEEELYHHPPKSSMVDTPQQGRQQHKPISSLYFDTATGQFGSSTSSFSLSSHATRLFLYVSDTVRGIYMEDIRARTRTPKMHLLGTLGGHLLSMAEVDSFENITQYTEATDDSDQISSPPAAKIRFLPSTTTLGSNYQKSVTVYVGWRSERVAKEASQPTSVSASASSPLGLLSKQTRTKNTEYEHHSATGRMDSVGGSVGGPTLNNIPVIFDASSSSVFFGIAIGTCTLTVSG